MAKDREGIDYGIYSIPAGWKDTSWIYDDVYIDTHAYEQDYRKLARLGKNPQKQLSIGSGLGRHIVIAADSFARLREVVAVDNQVRVHASVKALPNIEIREMYMEVHDALFLLAEEGQQFDSIMLENVRIDPLMYSQGDIDLIDRILVQSGWVAAVGDASFASQLFEDTGHFRREYYSQDGNHWNALSELLIKL